MLRRPQRAKRTTNRLASYPQISLKSSVSIFVNILWKPDGFLEHVRWNLVLFFNNMYCKILRKVICAFERKGNKREEEIAGPPQTAREPRTLSQEVLVLGDLLRIHSQPQPGLGFKRSCSLMTWGWGLRECCWPDCPLPKTPTAQGETWAGREPVKFSNVPSAPPAQAAPQSETLGAGRPAEHTSSLNLSEPGLSGRILTALATVLLQGLPRGLRLCSLALKPEVPLCRKANLTTPSFAQAGM